VTEDSRGGPERGVVEEDTRGGRKGAARRRRSTGEAILGEGHEFPSLISYFLVSIASAGSPD